MVDEVLGYSAVAWHLTVQLRPDFQGCEKCRRKEDEQSPSRPILVFPRDLPDAQRHKNHRHSSERIPGSTRRRLRRIDPAPIPFQSQRGRATDPRLSSTGNLETLPVAFRLCSRLFLAMQSSAFLISSTLILCIFERKIVCCPCLTRRKVWQRWRRLTAPRFGYKLAEQS